MNKAEKIRRAYGWEQQLSKGAYGVAQLVSKLRAAGRTVVDLAEIQDAQRRDIDLLVDGQFWEVKSDYTDSPNLFFELTCDDRPGCLFQSRADIWAYGFPLKGVWYLLDLPKLQWFIAQHAGEYDLKVIHSTRSGRLWTATGIAVPFSSLSLVEGLVTSL